MARSFFEPEMFLTYTGGEGDKESIYITGGIR